VTLPNTGVYLVNVVWTTSNTITTGPTVSNGNNISLMLVLNNHTGSSTSLFMNANSNSSYTGMFSVNQPGAGSANQLTFGGNASMSGAHVDLFILLLPQFTSASAI